MRRERPGKVVPEQTKKFLHTSACMCICAIEVIAGVTNKNRRAEVYGTHTIVIWLKACGDVA
jgi:hypothetical protein